jgi:EAL domain-containing protein (putative c-di-GMP-specific phosphodiesterase class I)
VQPADFIPAAEQTGLIVPIARSLLRDGCEQLRRWQERLRREPPLALGMNLTAAHLERSEVMNTVRSLLERRGIEGRQLVVEVTESMMIRRRDRVLQVLGVLKEMGVRISLDDFGLEYSSLSYLHELPVDSIKLDRSFIHNLGHDRGGEVMVRGIVALAHDLGKSVVAEGIETPEQLAKVREIGCDLAQGFLFAKPDEAHHAESWLIGEPPWHHLFATPDADEEAASFGRAG